MGAIGSAVREGVATKNTPHKSAWPSLRPEPRWGCHKTELDAKLKTAQQNVQRLEKGGSTPSTNTLLRIAIATGHKLVITFSPVS